jgi:hypothetical protein
MRCVKVGGATHSSGLSACSEDLCQVEEYSMGTSIGCFESLLVSWPLYRFGVETIRAGHGEMRTSLQFIPRLRE